MRPVLKIILGLLVLIAVVLITLGVLFNSLTHKSFYEESGTLSIRGIGDRINVYKTEQGVSMIFAENENDMYFALGYMHAQDRLWQMDLMRRVAEGRISEIFGSSVTDYDILFRTVGIKKNSEIIYNRLSVKSKSILSDYTRGINYFIDQNSKQLPLEFDILNYKPEEWKPEHSVMLLKLMSWELNLSWYTDFMFGEIVNKLGYERALDLFPDYPEDAPFIINQETPKTKTDSLKKTSSLLNESYQKKIKELGSAYFDLSCGFRKDFGLDGNHVGSNSWVVGSSRTENGKPILANDPHLSLQLPSKWYEVSLYDNQKKYSVSGFSIPGIPGIAIGHNEAITWGLTNLMCDDSDFYILKKDSSDSRKYVFKNEALSPDSTIEIIKIKDNPDVITVTVYTTILGPVISGLEKTGFTNNQKFYSGANEILTFRWTGAEFSDEIDAFYKINNAQNINDFRNALKTYGSPALNFTYADTAGNIAYYAAGYVPIRAGLQSAELAAFPSGEGLDWKGFVPQDEMPQNVNPEVDFIVTANNKPQKNFGHYISNLYEPHYRAERIKSMIESYPILSGNEIKLMQNDVYSLQAKEFCGYLFESFGDSANLTGDIKQYLEILKSWDFEFKINSRAATLFARFEAELYKNLYKDILGDKLFENYLFLKNIPERNTSKLMKKSSSVLFENNFQKHQLIRKSFYEAVSGLVVTYGNDMNNWNWGEVHNVFLKHPLGSIAALSTKLNIGPFKTGGSGTTVNNLEYSFSSVLNNSDFEVVLGPSLRMIVDLSDIKNYLSVIPSGQSGQPLHQNYSDQSRIWLNGDYKEVTTDFDELKRVNLKLLTFEPVK